MSVVKYVGPGRFVVQFVATSIVTYPTALVCVPPRRSVQPAPMIEPGAPVVKIVRRSVSSPPGIGPGRLMQPLVAPLPTAALKYGFDVDGTADELLFAGTPPG